MADSWRPGAPWRCGPLVRKAAATLALIGLLAGCTGSAGSRPQVAAPAPQAEPAPPPVAPAPAPPKPVRPPEPANLMKIAVLVPLTGRSAEVGQSIVNAATMALLDLNTPRLRLTSYNTETGAAEAAERAIADGAKVILGPLFNNEVRVVQPIAAAAGVPVITFSNDASVAQAGTFVLGYQPAQEIARVIGFARQRGLQTFGALVPQGAYGERASVAFRNVVQETGGRIGAIESYPRDVQKLFAPARRVTNYEARLATARASATRAPAGNVPQMAPVPFQSLMIADSGGFAMAFAPILRQFGATSAQVRFLGTGLWASEPDLVRQPALVGAWFASVPQEQFRALDARYRNQYGGGAQRLASLGYDGVLLVADVTRNWTRGQGFPTAALMSPTGFAGIDGVFRFRANGVAERAMAVYEVTPSGFRVVSAAPSSLGGERVGSLAPAPAYLAANDPSSASSTAQPRVVAASN